MFLLLQGWVLVDDLLSPEDLLEPVKESIRGLVEELAQKLYNSGRIKSKLTGAN